MASGGFLSSEFAPFSKLTRSCRALLYSRLPQAPWSGRSYSPSLGFLEGRGQGRTPLTVGSESTLLMFSEGTNGYTEFQVYCSSVYTMTIYGLYERNVITKGVIE